MNDPGFIYQLFSDVQLLEFKFINEEYAIKLSDLPLPPPLLFWLGCATQKADLGASLSRFRY